MWALPAARWSPRWSADTGDHSHAPTTGTVMLLGFLAAWSRDLAELQNGALHGAEGDVGGLQAPFHAVLTEALPLLSVVITSSRRSVPGGLSLDLEDAGGGTG